MDKLVCRLLLLFSTLSLHGVFVSSTDYNLTPIQLAPIPCNDKAVEKLSRLAATYINEDRTDGYKFALNRIANVHLHAQGPAGNVYYLDLDVLETKCHVGSPKPWKRCDIRPFMETQISGNCNTTILHTPEGYSYLYSYDCTLVPDPPEKLQQTCPTCPLLLPVDSPQALNAAHLTLAMHRRQSTLGAGLVVKKITRASAQVVPVKVSFVEYTVQVCPEGVSESGTCQRPTAGSDSETAGFCTGSVRADLDVDVEVQVSCEMFKIQNVDVLRPVQPQGHDLPLDPAIPTFPPVIDDPFNNQDLFPSDPVKPPVVKPSPFDPVLIPPVPSDPILPPVIEPVPSDPAPVPPAPSDHPVVVNPSNPLDSSSSESSEGLVNQQNPPQPALPFDSSSEEVEGLVALRPPLNFRYQRPDRKKRQALIEAPPPTTPSSWLISPSGPSPFRSCPGPSRYTTV